MSEAVSSVYNPVFGNAALEDEAAMADRKPADENDAEFILFGKDGLDFFDLLDIINPLQHIPLVSTLYRRLTGDAMAPAPSVLGGALFGGPIGALASLANVVVAHTTGKDLGEHVIALLTGEPAADGAVEVAEQPPEAAFVTAGGAATVVARGRPAPVTVQPLAPVRAPAGRPFTSAAPRPTSPQRRAVPDLGALAAAPRISSAGETPPGSPVAGAPTAAAAAAVRPAAATAAVLGQARRDADVFAALTYRDRLDAARRRQERLDAPPPAGALATQGGWFTEVMMTALDKYEAGAKLARPGTPPRVDLTK